MNKIFCLVTSDTSWEWQLNIQIVRVKFFISSRLYIVSFVSVCLSFRVYVKHHSPQLLPVPGHLVYKCYEIFLCEWHCMMFGKWRQNKDKEAKLCRIKCRAVNVMYRHRHHSHSVIFIPLFKRVISALYVLFYFLSHGVQQFTQWRWGRKHTTNKMTNDSNEKGLA